VEKLYGAVREWAVSITRTPGRWLAFFASLAAVLCGSTPAAAQQATAADIFSASQTAMAALQTARLTVSIRYRSREAGEDGLPVDWGCSIQGEYRVGGQLHYSWEASDGSAGEVLWVLDTVWTRPPGGQWVVRHDASSVLLDGCGTLSGQGVGDRANAELFAEVSDLDIIDAGEAYILTGQLLPETAAGSEPVVDFIGDTEPLDARLVVEIEKATLYWKSSEMTVRAASDQREFVAVLRFDFSDFDDPSVLVERLGALT
jgi:hypothetical protein